MSQNQTQTQPKKKSAKSGKPSSTEGLDEAVKFLLDLKAGKAAVKAEQDETTKDLPSPAFPGENDVVLSYDIALVTAEGTAGRIRGAVPAHEVRTEEGLREMPQKLEMAASGILAAVRTMALKLFNEEKQRQDGGFLPDGRALEKDVAETVLGTRLPGPVAENDENG